MFCNFTELLSLMDAYNDFENESIEEEKIGIIIKKIIFNDKFLVSTIFGFKIFINLINI